MDHVRNMVDTKTRRTALGRSPVRISAGIGIVACMLASTTASAEDGVRVVDDNRKVEAATFSADAATGRAWVAATIARRFATGKEARAAGERVPVAVSALTYDPATRAIVLSEGDTRITCASLIGDAVVPTGACRIVATIEPRSIDTGSGIAVRDHLVVRIVRKS